MPHKLTKCGTLSLPLQFADLVLFSFGPSVERANSLKWSYQLCLEPIFDQDHHKPRNKVESPNLGKRPVGLESASFPFQCNTLTQWNTSPPVCFFHCFIPQLLLYFMFYFFITLHVLFYKQNVYQHTQFVIKGIFK